MNAYDYLSPYKPEQWVRNASWITNRMLFLLYLRENNNERFYGGDYVFNSIDEITVEKVRELSKNSFSPEFNLIVKTYPKQFDSAFSIWIMANETSEIKYLEGK